MKRLTSRARTPNHCEMWSKKYHAWMQAVSCRDCHGSGLREFPRWWQFKTCPTCKGNGMILASTPKAITWQVMDQIFPHPVQNVRPQVGTATNPLPIDPELERLLAEEEEIERRYRDGYDPPTPEVIEETVEDLKEIAEELSE